MKAVVAVVLAVLFSGVSAADGEWPSQNGQFVVRYQSQPAPPHINSLHSWRLQLKNAAGEPVLGAVIEVTGGMPLHDHGLPTRPRVTTELGAGDYQLDGLRFHMAGQWEITLQITAGGKTDTVVIALQL